MLSGSTILLPTRSEKKADHRQATQPHWGIEPEIEALSHKMKKLKIVSVIN